MRDSREVVPKCLEFQPKSNGKSRLRRLQRLLDPPGRPSQRLNRPAPKESQPLGAPPFEAEVASCWGSNVTAIDSKLFAMETSASAEACCQAPSLEWIELRLVRDNSVALSNF